MGIDESLKIPFFDIESMRALDQEALQHGQGFAYMERAAQALKTQIVHLLQHGTLSDPMPLRPPRRRFLPIGWQTKPVLICAGKGNNGGDGVLLSVLLHAGGIHNDLILCGVSPENLRGDAALAWKRYEQGQAQAQFLSSAEQLNTIDFQRYGLVVDALFGTGFRGELEGLWKGIVDQMMTSQNPILSVDIPSHGILADWTVLMGFPRLEACFASEGEPYGQWIAAPLKYPRDLVEKYQLPGVFGVQPESLSALLPVRNAWAEKRSQGVVGLLAGAKGMTGAACLCSRAAMRSGVGMTYLACPADQLDVLAQKMDEVVLSPQLSKHGVFQKEAFPSILTMLKQCQAVGMGPGISCQLQVQQLVQELIQNVHLPWVVDADGINALAGKPELLLSQTVPPVLSPHEREWQRLFQQTLPESWKERIAHVREMATTYRSILILKGSTTVIGNPEGDVFLIPVSNSGLAKAGSGDVLCGLLSALRAQNVEGTTAALLGVVLHARAGFLTAQELGERGMLPMDVIDHIPLVLRAWEC